jgi:hypothetical protein
LYIADGTTANATSTNSLYLGANTKASFSGADNEIVIGYNAVGAGSNSVVLGNDSITKTILKGNVGIGTTAPTDRLHIVGTAPAVSLEDPGVRRWRIQNNNRFSIVDASTAGEVLSILGGSGNVGIGTTNPGTYKLRVQGTVCFDTNNDGTCDYTWSDIAMKRNIQELNNALGLVNQLNPVSFEFRYDEEKFKDFFLPRGPQFGLIAQDVEKILPQLVENTVSGYKIIKYEKLVPLLVGAIKEQQKEIEELKAQIQNSKH